MNRIKQRFESLRQQGRKALVSYVVMGDPAKDVTLPVMHALVESGTDIIELGIPFSDPNAEGPVIQKAHERALENGSSLRDALAKVKQFRETDSDTPVLLMGYTNLDINSVNENVTSIRSLTDLPVCVGFGIKDGASARAVADLSDGVVVGSVLVNQIAMLAEQGVSDPSVYASAVSGIITEIRQALDH